MPATKNNFSHNTNFELEGVDTTTFTVDFINAMTAETSDLSSGSATAGLEAVRAVIGSFLNILAEGPLVESDKQKTYVVRTDAVGTLISGNTLRDAIRALNGGGSVTATISGATVTETKLGILTAAAVS
tara:strand:+ start:892 stop:1278 length:387 start_codon:yes stop_codon:yes gene_type:complete